MPNFSTALSGFRLNYARIANAGNNIANSNTPGFRSRSLSQATGPNGDQVKISRTALSLAQGGFQQTGNSLDLALDGDGFFAVKLPDGSSAFTRAGNFTTNADGQLVDPNGNTLIPSIIVPPGATNISVDKFGKVSATVEGASRDLGQFSVATFPNPSGLQSIGNNLLKPTSVSGEAVIGLAGSGNRGQVLSGFVENSNVDLSEQFVELLDAKNGAAFNLKTLKIENETTKSLLDILA